MLGHARAGELDGVPMYVQPLWRCYQEVPTHSQMTNSSAPTNPVFSLATGPLYWFRDWPNKDVPPVCAGVYTIWHSDGRFIYVGIRLMQCPGHRLMGCTLACISHFSGRRSGDQFCVYVADRLVLPGLTPADIEDVSAGRHQMDAHVRKYIHANLGYRFVILTDGKKTREVEKLIKSGAWAQGKPLLNPSGK
jgi:hypothetical protein